MLMVTSKLLLIPLYATCFLHLLSHHVVASAAAPPFSFSFDFSNGSNYRADDLLFEGDAAVHGALVDLTANSTSNGAGVGRMSYKHLVPFYDSTTGQVASFTTRFTFAIKSEHDSSNKGDTMAFFLSSFPSRLPLNFSGANLGLTNRDGVKGVGKNRFIAVEFVTYPNTFHPCNTNEHIAIAINSSTRDAINASCLPTSSLEGTMTASITFDNTTNMLLASLHFDDNPPPISYQVSMHLPEPLESFLTPELEVGFSAATGLSFEYHQILSWSFDSTLAIRTETSGPRAQQNQIGAPEAQPISNSVANENNGLAVVSIAVSVIIVSILVVWVILSYLRWRRRRDSFSSGTTGLRRFEYRDLVLSKETPLGAGAFGTVYKGSYKDKNGNQEVAVKQLKQATGEFGDFIAELKTISTTKHINLIELKGWCCSRNRWDVTDFMCWCRQQRVKLFLVYELVPNGTLHDHLHRREEILPWEKRYQIIKGIGYALRYLHHEHKEPILHRDIKPSNILLDYDFNAKLADFGLSRTATQDNTKVLTIAIGTEGYMDPQCRKYGKVEFGRKSDVYSFGIVLLEIACTNKSREQVNELYKRNGIGSAAMKACADCKLGGVFNETQMSRVVVLGLKCSHLDENQRPYIEDAMKFLEDGIEFPTISKSEAQRGPPDTISSDEQTLLPSELYG